MNVITKFFSKKDYAEAFQNGKLYMNTLDYFWNQGFEDQKDILEGVTNLTDADGLPFLPEDLKKHQYADAQLQAVGYRYCNVLCMYQVLMKEKRYPAGAGVEYDTAKRITEFGNYAVIVENQAEFLRRIAHACKDFKYLSGPVNYHSPKFNGAPLDNKNHIILKIDTPLLIDQFSLTEKIRDSFDKYDRFSWQSEWRLSLYRGERNISAYTLNIGDIHDITCLVDASSFELALENTIKKGLYRSTDERYHGNVSRKEMRDLFCKLGDNKAWLLHSIC